MKLQWIIWAEYFKRNFENLLRVSYGLKKLIRLNCAFILYLMSKVMSGLLPEVLWWFIYIIDILRITFTWARKMLHCLWFLCFSIWIALFYTGFRVLYFCFSLLFHPRCRMSVWSTFPLDGLSLILEIVQAWGTCRVDEWDWKWT